MRKSLKITAFICSIILILSISAIFITYIATKNTVLDENKLIKSSQTVEIYSSSGNLIDKKSSGICGEYIKISDINDYTKNAFIAIEDKRFYSHNGIDFRRILGATLQNLKTMSFKEGASTITQQLIKNTHLSSEKTLKRKLQEIKLAILLEKRYTKEQILELYLNTIYFGKGAYGIADASKTYFNKPVNKLSINESAMLAGIIKAPSTYSPFNNYDLAIKRKNLVLKVMNECGFITDSEYETNLNLNLNLKTENSNYYDDYVNAVISELESSEIFVPYGYNTVKVYTYLDENLQSNISNYNSEYNDSKIIINSKLSGITAFYGDNSKMKRSPASCVKPWLVYAPMINDGYIKESSVIIDEKVDFNGYSPKNYNNSYSGAVTVKEALSKSLNVPAVKLLNGYGIDKANKYTTKMNLDLSGESLPCALGGLKNGLTLKELCDKYSVFNGNGAYSESSFIKKVYFDNVKIYEHTPKTTKVFSEETAYIVNDMLKSAVFDGTSKKLRSLPFEVCAKTGTNGNQNGNIDALSIAYTTDTIVGVWVGNYNNDIMPNTVTGSNQPSQISYKILEHIYKNSSPKPFLKPNNVIEAKIDVAQLLNDKKEVISDSGDSFYYIKGSEPTESLQSYLKPELYDVKISITNGKANLSYTTKNVDNISIFRTFNNRSVCVYNGEPINEFCEKLTSFGKYDYKIIAKFYDTQIEYTLPTIKFDKSNLSIFNDDRWLYD